MRKWIFVLIFVLFIGAAIPFIFSHGPFKSLFLGYVGSRYQAIIQVDDLDLSWFGPQRFKKVKIQSPGLDGHIDKLTGSVPFWSLSKLSRSMVLENGSFHVQAPNKQPAYLDRVYAHISGATVHITGVTREENQSGEFTINGSAANPSLHNTDIDLKVNATRIPSLFVDRLLDAKGLLAASLGPTFDCTGSAQVQNDAGLVDLNLSATNAEATIRAAFTSTNITLKRPLLISFLLTPELSEKLLKNVNPLFLTGIQSKTPVLLRLSDRDFSFPLPFDIKKIRIAQGTLDMGQIKIRNGRSLASLMALLKSENLSNLKQMNAWFTPVEFSVRDGEVRTGRTDLLLADSVHLCTWGDINLARDQIDMSLGLPADTLSKAFGLKNLPSHYVLKIPIRGPTQDPDIETGPAAAKIAALLAAQNLPKKTGAFGGIVNLFAPVALDDSSDVPPPKRPFPWEKQRQ